MALIKVNTRGQSSDFSTDTPKNLLINGGMMVDQRNATMQFNASSGYPCDRWYVGTSQSGTFQYTQSTDAPAGFGNSMKIQCTTADTSLDAVSYNYIMHKLEGNALQSMNSTNGIVEHTISFYAKASKTGVYTVNIRDEDNGQGNSKAFTISTANTWERYTLTFPAHSSGKLDNNNLSSYRIYWWMASGSNQTSGTFYNGTWGAHSNPNRVSSSNVNLGDSTSNNFFITGIQMEVGDTATNFVHRSFAEELALCERYFYTTYPYGSTIGAASGASYLGRFIDDTQSYASLQVPIVNMRVAPTRVIYNTSTGTAGQVRADSSNHTASITATGQKGGGWIYANNTSIGKSVSCKAHLTMDAEL